jgi:hypothetical protein
LKWEIDFLKVLTELREETSTRAWTSKKLDRTKIQFKGNKTCGTNRTRQFWLVVEDIRKVGQTWQEIKNKKHRKTEEAEYCCPYKT